MNRGASKNTCALWPSARGESVSEVGTRCRASARPATPLSFHRTDPVRSDSPVLPSRNAPFRPAASVSVRLIVAVRPETGLPARPNATFRPKMPSRHARTPLSDLPPPHPARRIPSASPTAHHPAARTNTESRVATLPWHRSESDVSGGECGVRQPRGSRRFRPS